MERLEEYIEELYPEGCTDVELNDFLWFERDTIADLLGYRDYEALVNYDIRDWKEHAKSVIFEHFPNADEDQIDGYIESEFTEEASDEEVIDEFKMYMKYCAEEDDENEDLF